MKSGRPEVQVFVKEGFTLTKAYSRKLAPPKTNQQRMIPVSSLAMVNELERYVAGRLGSEFLFLGSRKRFAINTHWFQESKFKPALEKLGIKGASLYSLRHTFASVMFQQGKSVIVVSKLMGHATVEQTLNTYAHIIGDSASQAMQGMGVFFDGLTGEERGNDVSEKRSIKARHPKRTRRPMIVRGSRSDPEKNRTSAQGLGNLCSIH